MAVVHRWAIKDSVFRDLFSQPENLLQLYQVLHPEDTTATEADLGNITIQNVLMGNLYNDSGFTVRDRMLIMVEAQSTWTVNIVWRLLLYQAETLNRYFQTTRQNTYAEKKLQVPAPEFYVLYTGERKERPRWNILADYLRAHEQEVRSIMLTLFDQEYLTKLYGEEQRAEGREEGLEKGRAEGRQEGREEGRQEGQLIMLYDLVKDGTLTLSAAAEKANQSAEHFRADMERYFADAG